MDVLSFISGMIESLAWPVSIIIIIMILKKPIDQLMLGIHRLKYQDLEIDFNKRLDEIDSKIETENNKEPKKELKQNNNELEQIETIAEISPNSAILLAWSIVEKELQSIVMRLEISSDYPRNSPMKNINTLREMKLIDNQTVDGLNELRRIRNNAAHAQLNMRTISSDEALRYYEIVLKITSILKGLELKETAV